MQLRPEIQITAIIKALNDVVIPAVDADNKLAMEQAHLVVGLLKLMAYQLPRLFRFDRDELQRLLDGAGALATLQSSDPAIMAAIRQLLACQATSTRVLARCSADPAELTDSVRDMRQAAGALMSAAAVSPDLAALAQVEKTVLALSQEQLLRDRALLLPQGWEPNPAAVPDIDALLQ